VIRRALAIALVAAQAAAGQAPRHRAILVSFDGLSEGPLRMFADSASTPALWSMLRRGVCADGMRPAFVSQTPSGHAAIYTGAYSNVNGVAAIGNGALPLSRTTILDWTDGYRAPQLSAEPIWITAARQGRRVFSQMSTQSPQAPAYPVADGANVALDRVRERAAADNQRWELAAVNVYNDRVADARVITEVANPPRPAPGWRNLNLLGAKGTLITREVSWAFGTAGDSLHALFVRASGVSGVVVSRTRDASRAAFAKLAPTDTSRSTGRDLARHFSSALRIDLANDRRTFVFARLFELSPDMSHFLLFVSEARVVQGNRSEVAREYDERVQGLPGNGAGREMERGEFGPTISRGGDGTAEMRYLETAELVTRQYINGTRAGISRYAPEFVVDYLPYPDETLHNWYALAHPSTPGVTPAVRAAATRLMRRAYQLVDRRLLNLQRLAESYPGTALFVMGEHGMRPAWMTFRPNVALEKAGIVASDSGGTIDLAGTQAAATRGWWISVNRDTRKGGIVSRDSVEAVLDRVERALRAVRDSAGAAIVTEVWRSTSAAADSLGLGGPAGGDLYYALAPGYYPSASANGALVSAMALPRGEHGFPSVDRDMWPALCVLGTGARAKRIGPVRAIDVAPTVAEWLGISAPADSRGRSLMRQFRP
jgi:hypothetical protein